ncbi:MAG: hypothetical protein JWN04_1752 [Myxococcaceae bacterium]|nr:hypothetical protein [Myxococcaceae bacterium]
MAASARAEPPAIYFTIGRPFLAVYVLLALAVAAQPWLGRRVRIALLSLLTVAAAGDFCAYWLSSELGVGFRKVVFWQIELPALAAALLLTTVRGLLGIRRGERRPAWALASALVGAAVATAALRYMPHGPALGLALALAGSARHERAIDDPSPRGTAWAIAGLLVLALAVARYLPYRPIIVSGAPARGMAPEAYERGCAGLRLHVFNTGINRMSPLLVPAPRPWRSVPAFAIEHPRAGVVAYDTGLSAEVARQGEAAFAWPTRWLVESRGDPARLFDVQLRAAGLSQVRTIVISHHHEDHTGTVEAFPGARVLSGDTLPFERAGPGPFDRSLDLLGDGCVRLIPGGGHTREDVMALLALPEGPVLLAGDAVVHFAWLDSDDVERVASEPARAAAVRNQVRRFLRDVPGAVLFPGHDLTQVPTDRSDVVLHRPEWFAAAAWTRAQPSARAAVAR